MKKEDIRIQGVIMHILDSTVGMPVLSDRELEFGSDLAEFLREHIYRVVSGDDCKKCYFHQKESDVYHMLEQYSEDVFVEMSRDLANNLYQIMNSNVDIPSADLLVVRFTERQHPYLAILKMNYKESFTHRSKKAEDGNTNELIRYKTILPTEKQRIQEAAVVDLKDLSVLAIEKPYPVNGERTDYFTFLFLKCSSERSSKDKLNIVTKAVERVQNAHYDENKQYEKNMEAKNIIYQELEEKGGFSVAQIGEKIFKDEPELKEQFREKMIAKDIIREEVMPQDEKTFKKYETQVIRTDSGIEIKIPMKEYNDPASVEFVTEDDGTTSVLIKNIGRLQARI
ncbi:MAG: nucleoid-associated protein [Lachnospiraceae bacterium]|nr:nucleoid-associated protein [Lachnospiraceae bacterium]